MQHPRYSPDDMRDILPYPQGPEQPHAVAGEVTAPFMPDGLRTLPEMAWCASADGRCFVGNDIWRSVNGSLDAAFSLADWTAATHADDRPVLIKTWTSSIADGSPFDAVLRHRGANGDVSWRQIRAVPVHVAAGAIDHWVGIASDVNRIKANETKMTVVADELSHRIGNIFTVIGGMLALSARDEPEATRFAQATAARIAALATAHTYIWPPAAGGDAAIQPVGSLITLLMQPYAVPGGPQVAVTGDDAILVGAAATCVTLLIHELATNAAKHGALSRPQGRVAIRMKRLGNQLTIVWSERGGPAIVNSPVRTGFGTGLIDRVTRLGPVTRTRRWWHHAGLMMVIRLQIAPAAA